MPRLPSFVALFAIAFAAAPSDLRAQECDPSREECGPDAPRPAPSPTAPVTIPPPPPYPYAPVYPPPPVYTVPPMPAQPVAPYAVPPGGYLPPPGGFGYEPYGRYQDVTRTEVQRRWGLGITGLSIFGGLWVLSIAGGALGNDWRAAVPVVGPWISAGRYRERFQCDNPPPGSDYFCNTESSSDRMLVGILVVDGLLQAGALAMGIAGLATKREVKITERVRVAFAPSLSPELAGVAAVGRF